MTCAADRDQLRREVRARRRGLSPEQRKRAARALVRHADRALLLRPQRRIAVYFAHGAEIDLRPLIDVARRRRCSLYLPVIAHDRAHRMEFHLFEVGAPLRPNRFGILEPPARAPMPVAQLDIVFAPLVAFDLAGGRLGSGAGFYDRALRRRRADRTWRRPRVIGVGYDCQRVPRLDQAPWDVRLDAVLTESGLHRIATSYRSKRGARLT
jgi:5-formyltetrahydrofolate cyclo-ligase